MRSKLKFEVSESVYKDFQKYVLPVIKFEQTIISGADGIKIKDIDNNSIIDYSAGQFCTVLGNSLNDLLEYLRDKPIHTNTATLSVEMLEAFRSLSKIENGMNARSIVLNTGAEAIEFALRYSKNARNSNGVICFDKGYHGLTLGAQSITYGGIYARPIQEDIFPIPTPDTYASENDLNENLRQLENICKDNNQISSMIVEPIVSVGGMIVPSKEYFKNVRQICDMYNILLIFDECQTGFGRTGTWFYYEQLDVIPDILVTAKAIGLGLPVSVVSIRDKVFEKYGIGFTHYSSHQNDPLLGGIINFGINFIEKNNILEKVMDSGNYFLNSLEEMSSQFGVISKPRGRGLILGCDLKIEGIDDYREISSMVRNKLLHEGALIQATNGGKTLRFLPSYLITKSEIDFLIDKMKKVLGEYI